MKILITYFSKTGMTEKIAKSMCEVLQSDYDVEIKTINNTDINLLSVYDVIFIGAPCHDTTLAKPVREFLNSIPENSTFEFAGFYTHSTVLKDGTKENDDLFNTWAGRCEPYFEKFSKSKNITSLGYYHTQAKASFLIEQFIKLRIIKDSKKWKVYKANMRQKPNKEDLEDAKTFAMNIIKEKKNTH